MKFVDSSHSIIPQLPGLTGMYIQIEAAARTCYRSVGTRYFIVPHTDSNINTIKNELSRYVPTGTAALTDMVVHGTAWLCVSVTAATLRTCTVRDLLTSGAYNIDTSKVARYLTSTTEPYFRNLTARRFVDNVLLKNGHGAMLEHGTVYLNLPLWAISARRFWSDNKYAMVRYRSGRCLVTTNYRTVCESGRDRDLRYFETDPTNIQYYHKRTTVRFIMDRVGSQSVVRHRGLHGMSFAQESTRYCNYTADKFDNSVTYVVPRWMFAARPDWSGSGDDLVHTLQDAGDERVLAYTAACARAEETYTTLIASGMNPQDARGVLPGCLKTELVVTAFRPDWEHFFELRDDSHAHPDIQYLAHALHHDPQMK